MRLARDAITDRLSVYRVVPAPLGGLKSLGKRYADHDTIEPVRLSQSSILECCPLETDGKGNLVDPLGRKVTLKGINMDASMKLPVVPDLPSYKGNADDSDNIFYDGDTVSFVGRPFPLDEAEAHFRRVKSWGYNTVRYLVTWEAVEHAGPGSYDEDFIDYTIRILEIIHKVGGLYVFLDPHQDVWSRFTGGSGAPMWTLYAAGLDPRHFSKTQAAVLHNEDRFAEEPYPKMLWTSNYKRLASFTMFTLFFGGAAFFPDLTLNDENIQLYLQRHFLAAMGHLWQRVTAALPHMLELGSLLGFESMNEPNCGLIGHPHLAYLPSNQQLRVDTTPTVYQSMRLGMGFPVEVDVYKITVTGPQKSGTRLVDPRGIRAWLDPSEARQIDTHYKWKRGPKWRVGECIYAQRKIWKWDRSVNLAGLSDAERLDFSTFQCELRFPNFFNQVSPSFNLDTTRKKIDTHYFVNHFFVEHYLAFKTVIRLVTPTAFVFMEPPVLEEPPNLRADDRHIVDSRTIYCPHYYDGMSLMFKTWNTKYNVNTLGVVRGHYLNPMLGVVFGERAIRNCIKKQFAEIKKEGHEILGNIPVLMSETGMPFDMDDKRAYFDGKYLSQTASLDALGYALEGAGLNHTYWCYCSLNCHKWGDRWNNEDFSFWSPEDRNMDFDEDDEAVTPPSSTPTDDSLRSQLRTKVNDIKKGLVSRALKGLDHHFATDLDDFDDTRSIQLSALISSTSENVRFKHNRNCYPSPDGVRAVGAVIRPYVAATVGTVLLCEFDLRSVKFSLTITLGSKRLVPTIIFLPKWHYPYLNYGDIYLTSGHVKYNEALEYIEWHHDEDDDKLALLNLEQTIIIKNNSGSLEDLKTDDEKEILLRVSTWVLNFIK